jgi:hypothetical protein
MLVPTPTITKMDHRIERIYRIFLYSVSVDDLMT